MYLSNMSIGGNVIWSMIWILVVVVLDIIVTEKLDTK